MEIPLSKMQYYLMFWLWIKTDSKKSSISFKMSYVWRKIHLRLIFYWCVFEQNIFIFLAQKLKVIKLRSANYQRNTLQGFTEILDVCVKPQTKLQIIQETGMSMRHLHFCLKYLLKQNLIKFHHRKRTYVTTEAGLRLWQHLPHDWCSLKFQDYWFSTMCLWMMS